MSVLLITKHLRSMRCLDPVNRFNHTSWVVVVTQTDRLKSVRYSCVIEDFVAFLCFTVVLWEFSMDVWFLSGRFSAHSIHTALKFLFRPGLMMHAGIYPLLPRYFPRFVEARFDKANRCASAHAHVSYTSVCLLYIELSINRHRCYRPITWDVQQSN